MQLNEKSCKSHRLKHSAWVGSAPFCAMRYTDGPSYLPVDRDGMETRSVSGRKANAQFKAASTK